jgi:hypothetical protein
MADVKKTGKKTPAQNFGDMFESFGAALGQIFNDPELGALSQADNPGQLVYKADCSCPKTNCKRHGYCEPCREYHAPKPPRCER